jgi:toxin-antitoxin system PIN domain toxin
VNVLIALIDPAHIAHEAAHDWFGRVGSLSWASCPITENGVLRIIGHPKYPNSTGSPAAAVPFVSRLNAPPGHVFWNDDVSPVGSQLVDPAQLSTPRRVTDTFLLLLAVAHGGQLATFDRHLSPKAVRNGKAGLYLIDGGSVGPLQLSHREGTTSTRRRRFPAEGRDRPDPEATPWRCGAPGPEPGIAGLDGAARREGRVAPMLALISARPTR